ncbi:MAG TPA: hypothetical protein PLH84_11625 [Candidatus Krumholzibacteria bacterium]|nr:hypothetical protein [Candidatus Krumholzibacteria bacterium]
MTRTFAVLLIIAALAAPAAAGVSLEFEAGSLWQTVNDVQVPNDASSTRFSLVDAIGKGPWAAPRVYLTVDLSERGSLRALAAPFSVTADGALDGPVSFQGEDFGAGPATATYAFNSYRLTYRRLMNQGERWTWWLGFTAKLRVAEISLAQPGVTATKENTGFVPLLHLAADWRLADRWLLTFDADALAGGPGRAEDVAVKLARELGDGVRASLGYRMVEGGADVDEAYAFAWLHSAVASVRVDF